MKQQNRKELKNVVAHNTHSNYNPKVNLPANYEDDGLKKQKLNNKTETNHLLHNQLPNNKEQNNPKISLRTNLTQKGHRNGHNPQPQNPSDNNSHKNYNQNQQAQQVYQQRVNNQHEVNKYSNFIKSAKQSQNKPLSNNVRKNGQNSNHFEQKQHSQKMIQDQILHLDQNGYYQQFIPYEQKKERTPANSVSTKNESFMLNTNKNSKNPESNLMSISNQTYSVNAYETYSQHGNQQVKQIESNSAKQINFGWQQSQNNRTLRNASSTSFYDAKSKKITNELSEASYKNASDTAHFKHPQNLHLSYNQSYNQTHSINPQFKRQENLHFDRQNNPSHANRGNLQNFGQISNHQVHNNQIGQSIPTFLSKKLYYQQQNNRKQRYIERGPSISKNYPHTFISFETSKQHLQRQNHSLLGQIVLNRDQPNSKSSMTVRNLQYGRKIQPQQRTKSHTKNYSNAQINKNQALPSNFQYYLGNHQNSKHNGPQLNRARQNVPQHNIPHNNISQHNVPPHNVPQDNVPQHNIPQHKIHQHNIPHHISPYLVNFTSTNNNQNQKNYILDSIAEKDQFNKIFVRGNNARNDNRNDPSNTILIQRQKQSTKYGSNKKLNLVSDSANYRMMKSDDFNNSFQNVQSPNNNLNLKYIRSPTNGEIKKEPQLPYQKIKNYDRYMKMNYDPSSSEQVQKPFQQNCYQQRVYQQKDMNNQSKSMDTSFKYNKSEANSPHQPCQNKTQKIPNQKPISSFDYTRVLDKQNKSEISIKNIKIQQPYIHQKSTEPQSFYNHAYDSKNDQKTQANQGIFKKTLDSNTRLPEFKDIVPERKQTLSFGFEKTSPYNEHFYQRNNFQPMNNERTIRLNSPDQKVIKHSENLFMVNSSPQYAANKLSLFSPTQKSLKPIQKNHFLSQKQPQNQRNNERQKKSIKKMLVSQSKLVHPKAQILYNLNFKDLKGQNSQGSRPNSRSIFQAFTKNQITKIFCSTFKIGENQNGCDCVPKCYWVDLWFEKLRKNPQFNRKSLISNLDKNISREYFGHDNIFKAYSEEEVFAFTDIRQNSDSEDVQTYKQIEKDIPRTCSDHPTFRNQKYRDFLRQVLIHFYLLDKKLGYVQGMNIICASVVYHSKSVYEAVQIMDFTMNVLNYRKLFQNDMQYCRQIANKTCKIIRHYCYDMYNYVTIQCEVDLQIFIMGWYFSMLGSFVPLQAMHFVINKFIDKQFSGIMEIIVTYFIFIKNILMQKDDPNQIMQELSIQAMTQRSKKIDWNQLISASDKLKISEDRQVF